MKSMAVSYTGAVEGIPPDLAASVDCSTAIHLNMAAGQEPECGAVIRV